MHDDINISGPAGKNEPATAAPLATDKQSFYNSGPPIPLTIFPDQKAFTKQYTPMTWVYFVKAIQEPMIYATKGDCPWLKLCEFGETRTKNNSLRSNANVTAVGGIEGDYDAGVVTVEQAASLLSQSHIKCIVYTSASHTVAAPRWRVLAPFSAPFVGSAAEMDAYRKQMVGRINSILGNILANESYTLSQAFYFGKVEGADYQAVSIEGDFIDLRDDLHVDIAHRTKEGVVVGGFGEFIMADCVEAINTGENYHRSTISIAMHLISTGVKRNDAIAQLQGIYQAARVIHDDEKWEERYAAIENAVDTAIEKNPPITAADLFGVVDTPPPVNIQTQPAGVIAPAVAPISQIVDISENGLAELFADRNPQFRWVGERGKWMVWDGKVWDVDKKLRHMTEARFIAKTVAASCEKVAEEKLLKKASTINAIQSLARSDPKLVATLDQWDTNLWVFNTAGGIVDLRTGVLGPHDPLQYMTKMSPVAPGGSCDRWLQFLQEVTNGDQDLIDYLARVAGLAMIGQVIEHKLFFFYGTGRNGKGVFINTLLHVFGDYGGVSPMEMLMESQFEHHPTDVADLVGRRLATASEVDEGGRWAEAKVKALTGGDPIKARFMRQDFFEFEPQFSLLVLGNHKPKFRNVDEAIRGRFQMIPFTQYFPETIQDKLLQDTLKNEAGGILQWCIDGCLDYQENGLNPPEAVTEMTKSYLDEQDILQQWIRDECEVGEGKWAKISDLYASWKQYAISRHYTPGMQKDLGPRLELAGFPSGKSGPRGRHYVGLAVKVFSPPPCLLPPFTGVNPPERKSP